MTEADGTTVTWAYDADYRLTGETLTAPNGSLQAQASYAYDGVGNRTSMTSGGATTTYRYNSLDELTSASNPSQSATPVVANGVVYIWVVQAHSMPSTCLGRCVRRLDEAAEHHLGHGCAGMDARAWGWLKLVDLSQPLSNERS